MKKLLCVALFFFFVLSFIWAGGQPEAKKAEEIYVGVTFDTFTDWMANVVNGVNQYGDEHPEIKIVMQDANHDVAKQLQQVENFIADGADAILLKPVDADGCGPMAAACQEAGIPFVATNAPVNCERDAFIGSDNTLAGKLQAEFLVEQLGETCNVVILQGDLRNMATAHRTQGNKEVFDQYPGIEIVSMQVANWNRDEGMTKMENWLNSGLVINAVVSNNDEMALGAAIALNDAGRDDILVLGVDGNPSALNALKDGSMAMTVFQNGVMQGYVGVETCIKLINGESVDDYIDVPYEVVTPDLADEYLAQ